MNWHKTNFLIALVAILLCVITIGTSFHNIDLSWNAKFIDLVDCNGIVCQDVTDMYNNSVRAIIFFLPITLCLCFYAGYCFRRMEE